MLRPIYAKMFKLTLCTLLIITLPCNGVSTQYEVKEFEQRHTKSTSSINITLYTRSQPNGVGLSSTNNYYHSAFGNGKVTKFTTNGWVRDWDPTFPGITKAYLNKTDANVINVNWAKLAGDINSTTGINNFNSVGNSYADLLTKLIGNGANANNFHLVGHGLGAHVSGYAAQQLFANRRVKVSRITGKTLDPTLRTVRNITSSDAQFVDVIHTTDVLGTHKALGTCDFFVNNGKAPQAGCGYYDNVMIACSHYTSVGYFEQSIRNTTKYLATKCTNYEDYKDGDCRNSTKTYMGEYVNRSSTGSYYLSVYLRS